MAFSRPILVPIHTKLHPPYKANRIMVRGRLQCVAGLISGEYQVITVIAPAGYGKSVLLSQWQQALYDDQVANCWLNLDESDNVASSFLCYLIAALHGLFPQRDATSKKILSSSSESELLSLLEQVLNDLWGLESNDYVVFIDDIHYLKSDKVLAIFSQLLQQLPPTICFVLSGRQCPDLTLEKLRIRNQVLDYTVDDIRFTSSEAKKFINEHKYLSLSPKITSLLCDRTEGWAAALQLVSLALSKVEDKEKFVNQLSGRNKDIADYLLEVVLAHQSDKLKNFLLKTAILKRMCIELCNVVADCDDSSEMLEEIESLNLFLIPLDDEKKWFRYHHLFQDFLCYFSRKSERIDFDGLYLKAFNWCHQHGLKNEAIHYALQGHHYTQAAQLLSVYAFELMQAKGDQETMLYWMKLLPDEYLFKFPLIRMGYISSLILSHRFDLSEQELVKLEVYANSIVESTGSSSSVDLILSYVGMFRVLSEVLVGELSRGQKNLDRWIERYSNSNALLNVAMLGIKASFSVFTYDFDQGLSLAHECEKKIIPLNIPYCYLWSRFILGVVNSTQGNLNAAIAIHEETVKNVINDVSHKSYAYLMALFHLAEAYYEQGKIESVADYILPHINTLNSSGYFMTTLLINKLVARYYCFIGQFNQAESILLQAESLGEKKGWFGLIKLMRLERIRVYYLAEKENYSAKLVGYHELIDTIEVSNSDDLILQPIIERQIALMSVRLNILEGNCIDALFRINAALDDHQVLKSKRERISLLIVKAVVLIKQNNENEALLVICDALLLSQNDDYIQVYVEEGDEIKYLLEKLYTYKHESTLHLISDVYLHDIISAFNNRLIEKNKIAVNEEIIQAKKILTKRESSIFNYLDSDLHYQQIAEKLSISPNTLKWNLRNIYRKLGVKNRTGAIARAHELEVFDEVVK